MVTAEVGNPDLQPEKADTTGVGIVYSPSWAPGFTASLDYYRINIKEAIAIVARQDLIDGCFAGVAAFCGAIERKGGGDGSNVTGDINYVAASPQNVLKQITDGIDFEFGYNFPMDSIVSGWEGDMTLRGLANYVFTLDTTDTNPVTGAITLIKGAGLNTSSGVFGLGVGLGTPHFRWNMSFTYALDQFSGTVTWRGKGAGKYRNDFIVCTTSCPDATAAAPTISENSIGAVHYLDAALNFSILDDHATLYGVVQNVLNRDPPLIGASFRNGWYAGFSNSSYDRIGRMFRAGIRFNY